MTDKVVLCGANSYEQKYYFNEEFQSLPQSVKDELHIMCVLFTEDVGGILTMEYDEKGNLDFQVISEEGDYLFDEIGSVLKIKEYQETKKELLEALELYYRTFFLGENVDWGEIQIQEDESGKLIWECPNCGNHDQDKMSVARRTCGYIGTQFWNQGRTQEIKEGRKSNQSVKE